MEVITRKTTKSEAKKLYNELMQKDNYTLEGKKIMTLGNIISWIFKIM